MQYPSYIDFVQKQTDYIKQGLVFFDIQNKTGKSYNDCLINFLQGSSLMVTNHCNFDDNKKRIVLTDILSDIPVIDPELFEFFLGLRNKHIAKKPLGGSDMDYINRNDSVKYDVEHVVNDIVKKRASLYFALREQSYHHNIQNLITEIDTQSHLINMKTIELENHKTYNLDSDELMFDSDLQALEELIIALVAQKNDYQSLYVETEAEYLLRKEKYPKRQELFKEKIQHIAEKYIFAIDNPLGTLKKSYIELFLLDKIDIVFLQGSSYQFSLGEQTVFTIKTQQESLATVFQQNNPSMPNPSIQGKLNFE